MTDKSDPHSTKGLRISSEDRPVVVATSRLPLNLIGGLLLISLLGLAVFFFSSIGNKGTSPNAPKSDRQKIATLSRAAFGAVQTLDKEPCHRTAIIQLIRAYKKAQMERTIVNEISKFEQACAPIPEARFSHLQALLILSEFKAALPLADALVAENIAVPDAWATRAEVKEKLGDLTGASHDLRQALALFPNPSRVVASSWYRLTEVLDRQGRFCEAVTPLQTYLSFDPTKRRTQQILTLLADLRRKGNCVQSGKGREVKLRFPLGASALVVDAEINGVSGRFIVDTGASNVILTRELANRAGIAVENSKVITIITANGPIQAKASHADSISLSGLTARNVYVNIHPSSKHAFGGKIDGLLGLSFIGNFEFNFKNGVLTLTVPEG